MTPTDIQFVTKATQLALENEQIQNLIKLLQTVATRLEYICALGKFATLVAVIIGIYWLFGKIFFKGV